MAFDKNFIQGIIKELIPTFRKIDNSKQMNNAVKSKVVDLDDFDFHPNYKQAVEMYERIKVHAELMEFPGDIFKARSPRMTDDEFKYLKENYKQVTMPVYLDFLSTFMRIFYEPNYSIEWPKDDGINSEKDMSLQKYIETGIPEFGSLESYMKSIVMHFKFTDANGCVCVRPKEVKKIQTDSGETVVDDSVKSEPVPIYFRCDQIIRDEPGEYMMFVCDEKTQVKVGETIKKVGWKFEFYDETNVWLIEQIGKKEDYKFRISLFFMHDRKRIPAVKVKGIPSIKNGRLLWVSPFMYCVDLLDLVAMNSSYLQVIISNTVFPYRIMYGDECGYEYTDSNDQQTVCDEGYIYDSVLEKKLICPKCAGTGLRSRINPFGVMLIRTGNSGGNSDKDVPQTPMAYVEPTIETPKFLMTKIADDESKARRILHLNTTTTQVQGGMTMFNPADSTATGMMMDTKAKDAFIKPSSDQTFEMFEFIIDEIGFQREGSKYKKPTLRYPSTFDFYTEQDYMNNIANAVKAGLPPFVIQTILFKYLQSVFYNEEKTVKVFNLIYNTDRLITLNRSEMQIALSRGIASKWESVLHDSALTLVQQLMDADKTFLDKDFGEQRDALIALAQSVADAIKSSPDTIGNGVDQTSVSVSTSDTIQRILDASRAKSNAGVA